MHDIYSKFERFKYSKIIVKWYKLFTERSFFLRDIPDSVQRRIIEEFRSLVPKAGREQSHTSNILGLFTFIPFMSVFVTFGMNFHIAHMFLHTRCSLCTIHT